MTGVRRVLYHLPELLAADPSQPVYVVEGEKDTDRLGSVGLVATTNSGGVGKWRPEYGKHLKGREVIILPDNDQKGREHAESVARALHGVAKSSKVLRLPGLPNKGDVSDWLDAGGTVDALRELASRTEDWIPDQQADASTTPQATPRTREELLATVNGFLVSKYGGRVNVVRVEKIGSIRGRFGLITAEGHRIKIGGINRLRPVAAVREAIADHPDVRVLIPEHKKRWPLWTHSVIQLAEVKDTGSPFDHLGEILRKLVYKSNEGLNPYAGEPDHGVPRDRDWQLKKYPRFGYPHCCTLWGPNRTLYVSFHHLFDYMRDRNLMLRDSDLRDVLAEKGFQPVDLYARDGDRQIKRRAWASPPDFDLPDF